MLRRDHPLRQVVYTHEVWQALSHGKPAKAEVGFEHLILEIHAPAPLIALTAGRPIRLREVFRAQGAPRADLFQRPGDVTRLLLEELLETPRTHAVGLHPVAEQRPALHRQDGPLVRPLLGEFAPPVDQIIEERFFVRAEPREENLIVGRREDVDVIDLHEAEPPYRAANLASVHFSVRPRAPKALAGERDSPRLAQCEIFLGHLPFYA